MNNKSKYRARCNKQEDGDECRQRIAHRFWKMQFSTVQAAADDNEATTLHLMAL